MMFHHIHKCSCQRQVPKGLPRIVEIIFAGAALVLLLPVILSIAIAVKLSSKGPVFFRQTRIGRGGRPFTIVKFRSMHVDSSGPSVTSAADSRITEIGRFLRQWKLDEFPEFWNVVKGDMSLVGPRPEVPQFVDFSNQLWHTVLSTRPGLTHPVTLRLRDEESLLSQVKENEEDFYLNALLIFKLKGYVDYLRHQSWQTDLRILFETLCRIFRQGKYNEPTVDEIYRVVNAIKKEKE